MTSDTDLPNSTKLAAEIVAAFVSHNSIPVAELPRLIASVEEALRNLVNAPPSSPPTDRPEPAVSIRKSVTPDFLVCLDDGKKFKALRRHLATLGLTPDEYRAKWNLPANYPMVAPNYAAKRSALARKIGLGHARKKAAPSGRGRKPKAPA